MVRDPQMVEPDLYRVFTPALPDRAAVDLLRGDRSYDGEGAGSAGDACRHAEDEP